MSHGRVLLAALLKILFLQFMRATYADGLEQREWFANGLIPGSGTLKTTRDGGKRQIETVCARVAGIKCGLW